MSVHRMLWRTAMATVAVVALAGTTVWMPIGPAVAMVVMTAVLGAAMGLTFKDDVPYIEHPVRWAATLLAAPTLYPGLATVVGEVLALSVGALLVAVSPAAVGLERRWLRGRLLPSETELAVMADPDEALRLQWEESTRLLRLASTPAELRLMLRLREQILDEVAQRSDGVLPDYVWAPPDRGEKGWFAQGV